MSVWRTAVQERIFGRFAETDDDEFDARCIVQLAKHSEKEGASS